MNINISMKSASVPFLQQFGSGGMMKSTKDKLERQQNMQSKVDFFEAQKKNLKEMECGSLEGIAKKLEKIHYYNDQINAAKQEYNNSQMFHILDEAKEAGEKLAKAAEKNKPKTKEERKKDMIEEALGTDDEKGALTEITEQLSELTADMAEESEGSLEQLEDTAELLETNIQVLMQNALEEEKNLKDGYHPIDLKV